MSNKIYWEPCDYLVEDKINGKEYKMHVTQQLKCDNPNVDKVWFTASASRILEEKTYLNLHLIMKDGGRHSLTGEHVADSDSESFLIQQMEHLLDVGHPLAYPLFKTPNP